MRTFATILIVSLFSHSVMSGITNHSVPEAEPVLADEPSSAVPVLSTFPTELTVDGLISLERGNFALQLGAFSRKSNAEAFSIKLKDMLNIAVDVVEEGGLYKIFINSSLREKSPCLFIPVAFPETHSARLLNKTLLNEHSADEHQADTKVIVTDTAATAAAPVAEPADSTIMIQQGMVTDNPMRFYLAKRGIFFLKGDSPWLNRYNYFGKSVALVNALIFTIIASFISMIVLLIVILLNRTRMEKEVRLRQYLLEQYQSLIIDYLFGNAGPDEFRKIASDNYRRQVLIDQMIDVSVNLKGDSQDKLMKLYKDLNLDRDSIERAYSHKWHMKIKGFRELAFMGITEANGEMYKALNSGNEILRMEAQIALVRLSETDPFDFLSQLKRPFSLWEQITLHDLIIQHDIRVPHFQRWLSSPNPTVVMFALRMIREFKQVDAEPEVRKSLLHRDNRVSKLAVEVAGDLGMRSTLDTMKRMYKFQDYNNCLEIVRSMGKMPDLGMMGFLKLVLDKEDDVQLQIEAVKAIENMGEEGVKALVKVMKSEYKNYNIIVRHVLDRRIY
jgi:hypothetical protein